MAKLIKGHIVFEQDGYAFDFRFLKPITVINGKSAIGKTLFWNKFKEYCAVNVLTDFVFINHKTSKSEIERLFSLESKIFIIDNADLVISAGLDPLASMQARNRFEIDETNQYVFIGRLISHYTVDLLSVATVVQTKPKHFRLWCSDAVGKVLDYE